MMLDVLLFLCVVILILWGLDWLLSKIKPDWQPTSWEEDEWR